MKNIYNLIYKRAKEKGIKIEKAPHHKLESDYIASGRRNVRFQDSKKVYSYRGTLIEIALKLGLISEQEYDFYVLSLGDIKCSNCNSFVSQAYVNQIGKCSNCGFKLG